MSARKKAAGKKQPTDDRNGDWSTFASQVASALRERMHKISALTADERERLASRFQEAVNTALEVPPDLKPKIEGQAARLIARSDTVDPVSIAWDRTRERARRSAAIGAVTTVPALVPGLGMALAALGLVADWRYVAEQQRDLVLEIAALFGQWPDDPTRDARDLFLAATATAFAGPTTGKVVTEILARQIARRGVARLLPGAGAAVAGALNYISTITIGRIAIAHFGQQAGFDVHGIIPIQTHPAMPWLRNAVVLTVEMNELGDLASDEARKAIAGLSPSEHDELLDLAAALTLASERGPEADLLLGQLGALFGFATDEIGKAIDDAIHSAKPFRTRLASRLRNIGGRGGDAIETAWRHISKLVRRPRPRRLKTSIKKRRRPRKRATESPTPPKRSGPGRRPGPRRKS